MRTGRPIDPTDRSAPTSKTVVGFEDTYLRCPVPPYPVPLSLPHILEDNFGYCSNVNNRLN